MFYIEDLSMPVKAVEGVSVLKKVANLWLEQVVPLIYLVGL